MANPFRRKIDAGAQIRLRENDSGASLRLPPGSRRLPLQSPVAEPVEARWLSLSKITVFGSRRLPLRLPA